ELEQGLEPPGVVPTEPHRRDLDPSRADGAGIAMDLDVETERPLRRLRDVTAVSLVHPKGLLALPLRAGWRAGHAHGGPVDVEPPSLSVNVGKTGGDDEAEPGEPGNVRRHEVGILVGGSVGSADDEAGSSLADLEAPALAARDRHVLLVLD